MPSISVHSDEYRERFFRDVAEEYPPEVLEALKELVTERQQDLLGESIFMEDLLCDVLQDPTINPNAEFEEMQRRSFLRSKTKS